MTVDCLYCNQSDALANAMTKVVELDASTVYLFRDSRYKGRCVVALKHHVRELFELTAVQIS